MLHRNPAPGARAAREGSRTSGSGETHDLPAGPRRVLSPGRDVVPSRSEELEGRLEEARRSARRETLWLAVGVTPATILPAGLAAANGHEALAVALVAGGLLIQGLRWIRSTRRVTSIETELEEVRADEDGR